MSAHGTIGCPNCGAPLTLDPATHVGHADGSCVRKENRAERFVKTAYDRIEARRAADAERIRLAGRGSVATQSARLAAAQAKRERKNAKRAVAAPPSQEPRK